MPKKTVYQNITPIPSFIPRQLAIDMLHSHGEIIELNPLVLGYQQVKAPQEAPADEFFSTWYEITERIQYIPGTGKLGSGKINFKGVFHDMPWGLQTHIYAPAGVDLRNKWQIRGNQPGEQPEHREMGSSAPQDGLYLREDVEIKCNFTMVPFVKSSMKAASKVLVERMIKKAELIDAELLRQMMDAGLAQPGDSSNPSSMQRSASSAHPTPSPSSSQQPQISPTMREQLNPRNTMLANSAVLQKRQEALRQSVYLNNPQYRSGQWNPTTDPQPGVMEMMGNVPVDRQHLHPQASTGMAIEMPGDYYYPPQSSPAMNGGHRSSTHSELSAGDHHYLQGHSGPSSAVPDNYTASSYTGSNWGGSQSGQSHTSPRPDYTSPPPPPPGQGQGQGGYRYNPQDFAQGSKG